MDEHFDRELSLTGYGTIYNEAEQSRTSPLADLTARGRPPAPCHQAGPGQPRRLSQVHGGPERRVAALGRRLRPGRAGDRRRLRILRSRSAQRDLHLPTGATAGHPSAVLDESHTITNSFQVGPDYRWSSCFDTYLHYKYQNAEQPLTRLQAGQRRLQHAVAAARPHRGTRLQLVSLRLVHV